MPNALRDNLARSRHAQQLATVLQQLFRRQALDVAGRTTLDGGVPELAGWVEPIAEAAKPLLLRLTQQGIVETQVRLRRGGIIPSGGKPRLSPEELARLTDGLRHYRLPTASAFKMVGRTVLKAADAGVAFDLWNPRVADAVDAATFRFVRETMETARSDLATALANLRRALKRGLQRGDALRKLAEDVHRIFADPYRAQRIAVTEASRAQHAGQLMAARESNVVRGKSWVASSDACDLCLSIAEKGTIGLDEPFYVDQKGGPYAVIHHPPAHPFLLLLAE